ncbi:hypothetical protein LUZ60_006090 [Juncus effusus]|nr:hypothetical protein LUZ60_006090 [Juncus effusus]
MMLRQQLCRKPLQFLPNLSLRYLSAAPAAGAAPAIVKLFSNPQTPSEEIQSRMNSLSVDLTTPDGLNSLLLDLKSNPDAAYKFFNWVSESEKAKLDSKCFNSMLRVLGTKSCIDQFWGLVGTMRKEKGYGIDKGTFKSVSSFFEKNGLKEDFEKLKGVYENVESRICEVLRSEGEEGEIFNKLNKLGFKYLSEDSVLSVLEKMNGFPKKAYLFYNWLVQKKNPPFEINGTVYNALIRVFTLRRESCTDELFSVLLKMKRAGIELENETYNKLMRKLVELKKIGYCVDLFQFHPSDQDFVFLLKKIVSSKDFELELVSKLVSTNLSKGNSINGLSVFNSILKSLSSVEKLGECDKVLKYMENGGFKPDSLIHEKVANGLYNAGKLDETIEYINEAKKSGNNSNIGHILDKIVIKFCNQNEAKKAYKVIKTNDFKLKHDTYKLLIEKLVQEKSLKEAFGVLGLMKNLGFPPFVDPFVKYIVKKGSIEDAIGFFKAMSVKEFPSKRIYLQIFEGLFEKKRYDFAQDLLSKSPGSVRNDPFVLELFYNVKKLEGETKAASL